MSSDSQKQQQQEPPSRKYGEEVLGKRVCVLFDVEGEKRLCPYMGRVESFKVDFQPDGSVERTHYVVFEDGDKLYLDLGSLHERDRLWWQGMPPPDPLVTAAAPPPPQEAVPEAAAVQAVLAASAAAAPAHPQSKSRTQDAKPVTPERPKKQRKTSHDDGTAELAWLNEMKTFLTDVPHGRQNKVISDTNARAVMRQVKKLATGKGIGYKGWPDDAIFYQNVKVDLNFDFDQMLVEAKEFENKYGEDTQHGWLMRHPITKLKCYQEYKTNTAAV